MANTINQLENTIDARGRSCPEPVILTQNALNASNGRSIEVLVDAMVAVENIKRFASNQGFQVIINKRGEDYSLIIKK